MAQRFVSVLAPFWLIEVIRESFGKAYFVNEGRRFMSKQTDMDYYQGRALREHELARTAATASVARIHLEMAEHYEKLIEKARASGGQVEIKTPAMRFGGR